MRSTIKDLKVVTELPQGAMTLRPLNDEVRDATIADGFFPLWGGVDDGRFVITPAYVLDRGCVTYGTYLGDRWETVATVGGLCVQVRAADCGAGCRCAGEFRYPPED